jgi:uncharacterized protein (DUF1697 family)
MAREPFVALLRGVNVGGKNKLPMADLAAMFVEAGAKDVKTYIQSGNVIFKASPQDAVRIPERVSSRIHERFGFAAPMVVRTLAELRRVLAANPYFKDGNDEKPLYVMFLAHTPDPGDVEKLDPNRSPGGSYHVDGHVIYLHLPTLVAASKLTNAYFDSRLKTISTSRNWRTVNKLVELMEQLEGTH